MINVVDKINELRTCRGWNEKQFASEAHLPKSTIASWYTEGVTPSILSLEMVCKAFDMTLSQFFSENREPISITKKQIEFIEKYKTLAEDDKIKINILIEGMLTK